MLDPLPTILQAGRDLRERRLSVVELVQACLGRIQRHEGQLRAWVYVDADGALQQAAQLQRLLEDGTDLGPLHGIPLGIKDLIDVAGWPTECGSPLRRGHRATSDAAVVAALRRAGAVLLGKTVTTPWAGFDPPPTANPWHPAHTPGGSSSGSAAAVAAGMCLAALGTQTGGSIIRPAAYCGVAGLKPGYGELPMGGIFPLAPHLDHVGPIGRRVEDLYCVWQVLALASHGTVESMFSRRWADHSLWSWIDAYGVNKALFVPQGPFLDRASPDVQAVFAQALDRLRPAVEIRPWELPEAFEELLVWHRQIMAVEAAAVHRETFPRLRDQYAPRIAALLEEGHGVRAVDYAQALFRRELWRQELAQRLHRHADLLGCLVMPATTTPPPGRETTGDPAFQAPWSYLGWPALTIPAGLTPEGLPVGLQFVALTVPQVFAMASLCERLLGFRAAPPLFAPKENEP
jgi:aspartyl-tRNA(Asn)/glutamyl-tRNA(Gln) amidotransferase subunit A